MNLKKNCKNHHKFGSHVRIYLQAEELTAADTTNMGFRDFYMEINIWL